jgi:hypothetical protein
MSETTPTTTEVHAVEAAHYDPDSTTTEVEVSTTSKGKKTIDKKTIGAVVVIAVVATLANALIMQNRTISDLNVQLKIADMRADVNNEFANDILLSTMNTAYQGMSEQIVRGQGRIEGIVQAINPDNRPDYTTAWHDGYDRGLNQTEDEKQSFYAQGYQDAKLGKERLIDQPAADVVPQKAVLKKEK